MSATGFVGPIAIGVDEGRATLRVTNAKAGTFAEMTLTDQEVAGVALSLVAHLIIAMPDAPTLGALCDAYEVLGGLA